MIALALVAAVLLLALPSPPTTTLAASAVRLAPQEEPLMALLFFVFAAMAALAPGRDHAANGTAIASVVLEEPPLFKDDASRLRTAALVVAIAFRESSFRNDITSKTNDSCMMQINRRPDLAEDAVACVRVAMTMLRESMRMCPEHPIAFYASGPGACENARSQRISRDRMALAKRIAAVAP